jgi:hypothetical protein
VLFLIGKNTFKSSSENNLSDNELPNKPNSPYYTSETYYLKEVALGDKISIAHIKN